MKKSKYYVVWKGRKTGIFTSWNECKQQIDQFSGAKYKSFPTKKQAEEAYKLPVHLSLFNGQNKSQATKTKSKQLSLDNQNIISQSICVDASCLGNPGILEYQGVETTTKKLLFRCGPYHDGTNNIGEFLAIVNGLTYLHDQGDQGTVIYSDSRTAMLWVQKKQVKTTLKTNSRNQEIFQLIDQATSWLHSHSYKNQILKWNTPVWGEIPADFGRK